MKNVLILISILIGSTVQAATYQCEYSILDKRTNEVVGQYPAPADLQVNSCDGCLLDLLQNYSELTFKNEVGKINPRYLHGNEYYIGINYIIGIKVLDMNGAIASNCSSN